MPVVLRGLVGILISLAAACQAAPVVPVVSPTPSPTRTAIPVTATPTRTPRLTSTPTLTPAPAVSTRVPEDGLRGTQITFAHPWAGALADQVQALVDEFNQDNAWSLTVHVTTPGSSGELFRLVQETTSMAARPDVVVAYPEQIGSWQASGRWVVDLAGYLGSPTAGIPPNEIIDFTEPFWDLGLIDGQRLGIPAEGSLQFMFYNQTWARELGFNHPPDTVEAFQEQACMAAQANKVSSDKGKNGTGGWLIGTDSNSVLGWLAAFGSQVGGSGQAPFVYKTQEGIAAFSYLKRLVDRGCAWLGLNSAPYDYFTNRNALFYTGSVDDVAAQEHSMINADSRDQWTVLPWPSNQGKPVVVSSGKVYALLRSTPVRQEAGWLFMRWLAAPEQQVRLVQVSGAYPVRGSLTKMLDKYLTMNPHWAQTLPLVSDARPAPQQAGWLLARGVLQDAAWQIFQPEARLADIPAILDQLDRTTAEILQTRP